MKKITAWAKAHKIAAVFIGAGSLVVVGFVFIIGLGLVLMAAGVDVEPEVKPTEQVAKAEPEPETKAPEKTKAPEPKKTQEPKPETKQPEPKKSAAPKAEKPEPKKADPAADLTKRMKAAQGELNVFFETCKWENKTVDEGAFLVAMSACESEYLGVMVADNDTAPKLIIDQMADDGVSGKYFIEDGLAVWSTDDGTLNMAWDVLGTPGTPAEF